MFCMKIVFKDFKCENKQCLSKCVAFFWFYFARNVHCLTLSNGPEPREK